jgi:hypothetical protein
MVNYRVHKSLPPVLILSQMNPIHTPKSCFLPIYAYVFLVVSSLQAFQPKLCTYLSPHARCMPCPYLPWFDHLNNIWGRVQIMELLIMPFSPSSHHSSLIPLGFKFSPKWWNFKFHNRKHFDLPRNTVNDVSIGNNTVRHLYGFRI